MAPNDDHTLVAQSLHIHLFILILQVCSVRNNQPE